MLQQSETPGSYEGDLTSPSATQDWIQSIWRWKSLPILGCIIGLAAGYYYFTTQPQSFESVAMIQVVYPGADAAVIDPINDPDSIRGKSRLDESMIIKSVKVVDLAVELSELHSHPKLAQMTPLQLRNWIQSPSRLTVQPAGRDASTALIEIRFKCADADVCRIVIDSLIAGYDRYLHQAYRNLGNDVVEVVTKTEERLRQSYQELAKKNNEFRQNAPLVWLGDEAKNHFAENCVQIQKSINDIEIEIGKLQSLVKYIQGAERQGRTAESILPMLTSDAKLRESLLNPDSLTAPAAPASSSLRSEERRANLVELQIKEQELLDTVGEGHPAVAALRRRIGLINEHIAALADSEKIAEMEAAKEPLEPTKRIGWWKSAFQDRLAALQLQRQELRTLAAENERKSKELGKYLGDHELLKSELASAQGLLESVTSTLKRIDILPEEKNRRSLQTLTPPSEGAFAGPKLLPFLFSGGALGFIALAGLAIALDWFDKGFHSPDEICTLLGLPVVGHVPVLKRSSRRGAKDHDSLESTLCTANGTNPFGNEAFRSIRTGLFYSDATSRNRVIQVTSPIPGDGKSTVSTNLAISIAQAGRTVLLLDADMRRPRVGKMFGMSHEHGLADVLRGTVEIDDAIHPTPVPGLSVMAGCRSVRDPSELLSHGRFSDLIEVLREKFDYVIVDTPPVLAVSDPCSVAAIVDGVLLTVRLRRNAKPLARQASQLLDSVGARKFGVVVNAVTGKSHRYEYRYNQYGYDEATTK